jgi:hypothetical protein
LRWQQNCRGGGRERAVQTQRESEDMKYDDLLPSVDQYHGLQDQVAFLKGVADNVCAENDELKIRLNAACDLLESHWTSCTIGKEEVIAALRPK